MPKIEVKEKTLHKYAGMAPTVEELIDLLPVLKSEVDGADPATGTLKLEFNDTNRPDLWSTAGAGRGLKTYYQGTIPTYSFFSTKAKSLDHGDRVVKVDVSAEKIRPYIAAFAVKGNVDQTTLDDLIQTQEKLCWNFGRKRKSIAMGVYRSSLIQYPVHFKAVDPVKTSFQPLGLNETLNLKDILKKHPKGQEYGHIVEKLPLFPFLTDDQNEVLSFPPVINSAKIGAVEAGDTELFIELTGTELPGLALAASIVACDLADAGFTILPVRVEYAFDTPWGKSVTFPYYFQDEVTATLEEINNLLGINLIGDQAQAALKKMGVTSRYANGQLTVVPPPYRNDFLHPVDIVEDVLIGRGLATFEPIVPQDSTIGRLTKEELFARQVRDLFIGMGFQEMIFNYLGSRRDFIEKMNIPGDDVLQILNPMTENYEFVRNSIAPNLLEAEGASGHAIFPHHIFEVGKICKLDTSDNQGSVTRNSLGFLSAGAEINFNLTNSQIATLFYYLDREYSVKESTDPRFIPGRAADLFYNGKKCGVFGEVHPQVLENWGIGVPATLGEVDLDTLLTR